MDDGPVAAASVVLKVALSAKNKLNKLLVCSHKAPLSVFKPISLLFNSVSSFDLLQQTVDRHIELMKATTGC